MAWTGASLPLPVPRINLLFVRMMVEGYGRVKRSAYTASQTERQ